MICPLCLMALSKDEIQRVIRHAINRLCDECTRDIMCLPEPQRRLFKALLARVLEKADA